jgi:hypothetical protein
MLWQQWRQQWLAAMHQDLLAHLLQLSYQACR